VVFSQSWLQSASIWPIIFNPSNQWPSLYELVKKFQEPASNDLSSDFAIQRKIAADCYPERALRIPKGSSATMKHWPRPCETFRLSSDTTRDLTLMLIKYFWNFYNGNECERNTSTYRQNSWLEKLVENRPNYRHSLFMTLYLTFLHSKCKIHYR
jgi:hypothetical protein